jgi:hypothetical protein
MWLCWWTPAGIQHSRDGSGGGRVFSRKIFEKSYQVNFEEKIFVIDEFPFID